MGTATKEQPQSTPTSGGDEQPEIGLLDRFLQALAPPDEWVAAHSRQK